jgi:hypothetical protein
MQSTLENENFRVHCSLSNQHGFVLRRRRCGRHAASMHGRNTSSSCSPPQRRHMETMVLEYWTTVDADQSKSLRRKHYSRPRAVTTAASTSSSSPHNPIRGRQGPGAPLDLNPALLSVFDFVRFVSLFFLCRCDFDCCVGCSFVGFVAFERSGWLLALPSLFRCGRRKMHCM